MKKSIFAMIAGLAFMTTVNIFAEEAKFIRNYDYGARFYENAEYLNGNYRSNFVSIPQNRMLNYKDGFERKIGVFELEGNTLFVGYSEDGSGALQLCDENGKMWISKDSYKEREESYFKYQGGGSGGVITQIELKGKKYTLVIAGISSNKAGIYSDYDGFRMWVENEAPNDTAASKTIEKTLCYEAVDIREGLYKPGYTRLWGQVVEMPENAGFIYKYSYKGSDFIFNGNSNDSSTWLQNTDEIPLPLNIVSVFNMYETEANGKTSGRFGLGIEADVQLGNNTVRIVFSQCDGTKRVWVKDTSGYPVIQQKNTNQANEKKSSKAKVSAKGKAAKFTRNFEKWARVYSKADISKGIYKTNYKNVPQSDSREMIFTPTSKDGSKSELKMKNGIFDLGKYKIMIYYIPEYGWIVGPVNPAVEKESWSLKQKGYFLIEDTEISGREADVIRNDEVIASVVLVAFDTEKGDYRLFEKTGPDEETAMSEKDVFDIEYYNCVDVQSGIYKPGFEKLSMKIASDESQKALFENVSDNNPVFVIDYNGYKFLVGPANDPANYVKNLDGSVIHNPETQIRYMLYTNDGKTNCKQGSCYGWEGKVKLGDKEVTLAVFKWNYLVNVFVKE
ncbi:MAG: hypothetical protein SPH83_08645 [Treponema sp.]|nr:hypothetical protein [Spirochaetales bacterium]MDY6190551.1 hypothetical protein [Treponema sp.]